MPPQGFSFASGGQGLMPCTPFTVLTPACISKTRLVMLDMASQHGFCAYRRDIFLDVVADNREAILQQLFKAEALARSSGQAIIIGHPLPNTLLALQE